MPPILALILTTCFVAFLFWRESRNPVGVSSAMWIPLIWVLITGTRFLSQWLGIWGLLPGGEGAVEEGSPLDAIVFAGLIAAGIRILVKRRVKLKLIARNNTWLTIFFVYCFLAILWSDFPFVAFKRWIKVLGHPVLALVLLTELSPVEALRWLFKRASFVMITGSVLCIKYFPNIGRGFDKWSGEAFNNGVNLNKNELGYVCLLMGIFFVWNLLQAGTIKKSRTRLEERALSILFLGMIVWLLHMCNSATSQVCLATGVGMMFLLKARWLNKRYLGTVLITGVVAYVVLDSTFDIYANTLKMLGRKPSLTDRTEVWADALALVEDPVLGAGFESFWLGDRLKKMWAKWHWQPTQAHSGYIETYLNLGFIGVGLLLIVAVTTFKKIQRALLVDFQMGQLRMGYFVALWLYNYTEAAFKGVSLVWLVFHIIAMDYPRLKRAVKVSSPKLDPRMVPQRQGGYP